MWLNYWMAFNYSSLFLFQILSVYDFHTRSNIVILFVEKKYIFEKIRYNGPVPYVRILYNFEVDEKTVIRNRNKQIPHPAPHKACFIPCSLRAMLQFSSDGFSNHEFWCIPYTGIRIRFMIIAHSKTLPDTIGMLQPMHMSRLMTKPTKWLCAQRRLRSAWASAQSDQNLRCALSG